MASVASPVTFKEFCPVYYLLNAIPTKVQKGFRSIVVYLTALDTNGDYIAVGSSIGMLYLYCRRLNQMKKYNFEGKSESITVVKLLSCFDDLVAIGTASGRVAIFQLVSSLPGRNKQLRRFDVAGIHKSSITALAWSPNGMKLFSGDDRGKIVYSSLDLDQGVCNSSLVLEELSSIVQLDYSQKVLLVSTLQRTLLFYTEEKSVKQVGTQSRKNTGKFGACFIPGLCKQSDLTMFAARPGLRLWKSDVHGTVQATFILKELFAGGIKPFELYPRLESPDRASYSFPEKHLGLVSCFFQEGWVLSWNEYSIYLLDTVNQALIGGLEGYGDIVSVSCTSNEIFLLKGDRDIIRISSRPEGLASIDSSSKLLSPLPDLSPKLLTPLSVLTPVSSDPSVETEKNIMVSSSQITGDKNDSDSIAKNYLEITMEKSIEKVNDFSSETRKRGCSVASESRSRSSSINSVDSGSSLMMCADHTSSEAHRESQPSSQRFSIISSEDFDQELIVKPIKVKKKKKKKQENGTKKNHSSLEGKTSTEAAEWVTTIHDSKTEKSASSDEEDIYGHGLPYSSSETSVTEMGANLTSQDMTQTSLDEMVLLKSDQFAESWMGYSGPGYGILSLVVSEKYVWCLDYKGSLFCSALPSAGIRWQKFEDAVQQVAVSPSGALLWKIEQKTNKAFACGKVTIKGKRHWYEALPQAVFVALSDDTAWIIRTNGDLYLQTGLSVDRPCARAVKVDCPYPLSQITSRNNVVWALTEQRALLYREGVSSFCPEGEQWKCDIISEMQALEPMCITLGDQQTLWALDIHGNLWFRTGVVSKKPQGDDDHWWQVSITDYVVFDQCSLFQTIIQATQTVATAAQVPVEKVADKLRMAFWSQQLQCQPSLLGVSSSGVWISSGKNEFHVAKGSLVGTYWNNIVPRGTASATKWVFVLSSTAPTKEGSFLWLCQSNKDLFCVSDQNPQFHPSTLQLPPDAETMYYSACQDAIWGLDTLGRVFIRTLSPSCPTGMHWTKLDLAQLGAVKLTSLACGNQHVWACDTSGGVYFRVGTQPLNPSLMLPAWIMIEPPIQPVGINLVSVHSSPNDQMLWAIDNKCNVHVRIGITEEMPVGTDWEHIPGLQACQLAISTRTVWARCPNGDVARRYGVTDKNPAGDYWKKIPGNVSCLTVTPLDELWAVSSSGYLLQRLTKTFSHSYGLQKDRGKCCLSIVRI
ncbi:tectonin beta-propeller repeat-containing protein 2 [Alligator mississippiensis]|uniref:Tectonin beta-propeller repeat-containing protein 2 n=1 Tax=Alligator mississippiensis TaxID=8496 RepID=A0A151P915_ALLMI|nr:tectonin beta-propeller repeat-containing protein 2 [Alligator mississippiensis]